MKKMLLLAMLGLGFAAQSQTDYCTQAKTLYSEGKYDQAMKAVNRDLVKSPDHTECRKIRINSALKASPSGGSLVTAMSDLNYLLTHGDKSETTYKQMGDASSSLAKLQFDDRDYASAVKQYTIAKEAYQKAKSVSGKSEYDRLIADTDSRIKDATSETKP